MSAKPSPAQVEMAAWLFIVGGLLATIGIETNWGRPLDAITYPVAPSPAEFQAPSVAEPFRLPPIDTLLDTAMRPIFLVTRRPAPAEEVQQTSMNKGQFVLTGVTVEPGARFAFLLEKSAKKPRVVREGSQINGLLLKEVMPERVVLTQGEDSEVLELKTAKGPATTTQPNLFNPGSPTPIAQPDAPLPVPAPSQAESAPQTTSASKDQPPPPSPSTARPAERRPRATAGPR